MAIEQTVKTQGAPVEANAAVDSIRVRKIQRGTVIDHLTAGSALSIAALLGIDSKFPGTVSILMNCPSTGLGLKDIVKIEGRDFSQAELEKVALFAPFATINIVRNWRVEEKFRVKLPAVVSGLVSCPNPICITRFEGTSKLAVEEQSPLRVRCSYCGRVYKDTDIINQEQNLSVKQ